MVPRRVAVQESLDFSVAIDPLLVLVLEPLDQLPRVVGISYSGEWSLSGVGVKRCESLRRAFGSLRFRSSFYPASATVLGTFV
jgi:hypothetical protein